MDIAKYIFTAVIIAKWFNSDMPWQWYDYILPLFVGLVKNDNLKRINMLGTNIMFIGLLVMLFGFFIYFKIEDKKYDKLKGKKPDDTL